MRRDSDLELTLARPLLPYPILDTDSTNSLYSPVPANHPPDDDSDPLVILPFFYASCSSSLAGTKNVRSSRRIKGQKNKTG